jgi:hypothetical protein
MVSTATAFEWRLLCLPYLVVSGICLLAMISAGLIRGDRVVRIGLIGTTASVTPWTLGMAAAICAVDRETAARLYQLANGSTTMLGPSLLLILLSVSGQLDRYRWHARAAIATGVLFALVTWSTRLVLDGAFEIPSGIWYPRAGALMWLHSVQIVGWPMMGLIIALRAWPARQRSSMMRYLVALPALPLAGTLDTLLAYGIGGIYPLAWLPASCGGLICLHLMFRTELLRSRGIERAGVVELTATALAGVAIAGVVWMVTSRLSVEPAVVAMLTAPLWAVALLVTWMSPRAPTTAAIYDHVLEELAHDSSASGKVAERLGVLWGEHAGLSKVRLRQGVDKLDPQVRGWLRSLDAPVMSAELATMRLGLRRPAINAMFAQSGAAVVVPVIDRGELIAVVEAEQPSSRTLRDAERLFLFDSAQLVGHALTYDRLARDAQAAVTSAREVELANVLAAHYRPLQDDERGPWRLAIEHRPSASPGGAGWSWAPLPDGRVAAMIAEAESQGVAGALVIAALQGAFAARSRESSCDAAELLAALGGTVSTIGRRALVLVLDSQARTMCWASDGHLGAAIVSEGRAVLLRELAEEQGEIESGGQGEAELPAGALVMLLSSSVLEAPGLARALASGLPSGLRLVTQLVELAGADAAAPSRDLLAIGLVERAS